MLNRSILTALVLCVLALGSSRIAAAQDSYGSPAKASPDQPSLYERLGGLMGISAAVSDLIDLLVMDDAIHMNKAVAAAHERVSAAYLKYQVTSMVCQATGGPCEYHGRTMKEAHAHLNITEKEWERAIVLFNQVMAKHTVPEAESAELLGLLNSVKPDIVVPEQ
jgi:hemoglobin